MRTSLVTKPSVKHRVRNAEAADVPALVAIEETVFATDRLSLRSFKHWVQAPHRIFVVIEEDAQILGYALVLLHRGTRLARLYSIAIAPTAQGRGLSRVLMEKAEELAASKKRFFMRLEVAKSNEKAIALYSAMGYKVFGHLHDYYEDHQDALRMQKRIRFLSNNLVENPTPWFQQTTDFTCGPASLMMAMASLGSGCHLTQMEELDIWRESTTIFMTSGLGGCHPIGLGLAAAQRGFSAEVYVNTAHALFTNSVRGSHKKDVVAMVDQQFRQKASAAGIDVLLSEVDQAQIAAWLGRGYAVIVLVSTYRMDGKKAPHWVTISGIDDDCLYVHDPDPEEGKQDALDCQYMSIAREDFNKMSSFGREKLRTCVLIKPKPYAPKPRPKKNVCR